jgi:hypothetical protein
MRRVLVVGIATLFLLAGVGVARADHTHVLVLPNSKCAILAAEGNEKYLILPEVLFSNNPNVDADDAAGGLDNLPLNRRHPPARAGAPGCSRRRWGHRRDGLSPGSLRRNGELRERIAAQATAARSHEAGPSLAEGRPISLSITQCLGGRLSH